MGTRTYSRRGVLTAAGRRRAGLEAIDIFGNPIPDRTAVPVPARPAAVSPQPVAVAPEPVAPRVRTPRVSVAATTWSPYQNKEIYNPAQLSGELQKMIKGGGDYVFEQAKSENRIRGEMNLLGLNSKNRDDCQIYADLKSVFEPKKGISMHRELGIETGDGGFIINNHSFKTKKGTTPDGTGYAMVARQLAAMQEIATRTGKKFTVRVQAVGVNESESTMSGALVWPKLGYEFGFNTLPSKVYDYLIDRGFDIGRMRSTADLMLSKNAAGESGFDVWRDACKQVSHMALYGTSTVTPDGTLSIAQRVTKEYGKRKGFVKGQSSGEMFDDAVLRDVWESLSRKD